MSRFRHLATAMVRASAQPEPELGPWPSADHPDRVHRWLIGAWSSDTLRFQVRLASPGLADRLDALSAGTHLDGRDARRAALALARYLVRGGRRATPFGLFAGIGPAAFGPAASVHHSGPPEVRLRPDAVWLADVISRLERAPELRNRLKVGSNNLVAARGDRLVLAWQPHGTVTPVPFSAERSVARTAPVEWCIRRARTPLQFALLVRLLRAEFPTCGEQAAVDLVAGLMGCGMLISQLRVPSTVVDPLGLLLDQLHSVSAEHLDAVAGLVADLQAVWLKLGGVGLSPAFSDAGDMAVVKLMRELAPVEQPLVVDLRLSEQITLPSDIATEVEAAAGVLARLAPHPAGRPEWRAYHQAFLTRYGTGSLVPVTQLVDPVCGLGYPKHFTAPREPASSARDGRLCALAERAVLDGVREICLDDDAVTALSEPVTPSGSPMAHLEVCVEVHAGTVADLNTGQFTLTVAGTSRSAAATRGRFLDLLPEPAGTDTTTELAGLVTLTEGAVPVQVSFPPHATRPDNVLRSRQVLPEIICLAELRSHADTVIGLDDLAVTATGDRLVLVQVSRRRVLEPMVTHAGASHTMPPLGRLLLELPAALACPVKPLDWGAASAMPFRPALRYGRVILSPAAWHLDPTELPGPTSTELEWTARWRVVRRRLRLPDCVRIGHGDQQLRLMLAKAMDRALLRVHLDAADGPVTITEAAGPSSFGWLDSRAAELVVGLTSIHPPAPPPSILTSGPWPPHEPTAPLLPGSRMLSARLLTTPELMDTILTRGLPALLAQWETPPEVWFLRMRHPEPHLRLRVHTADYGTAAMRVGRWAEQLRQHGWIGDLVLDTYRPETHRYGPHACMDTAELLFTADSAAAQAQLDVARQRCVDLRALTAVSMVDLAGAMLGGPAAGREWLIAHPELAADTPTDRTVLRQSLAVASNPDDDLLAEAWTRRRRAAQHYADTLAADGGRLAADSVLPSLLHLHFVRSHLPDPHGEAAVMRLARAVALATARTRTRTRTREAA
ncbi:hypothetical protein Lfu02_75710 [Longispora fulva]|uniref:Thiopeptide-type bacteriocin biosynthesis protein n=1 Tax=Longispora fulva TaxID=619741 RepID=A0A8J7G9K9_9ACTN|nr:lantibiotic dehydratase [Longispora fulva]MBG6136293.1 thiopeptide-type bacteriocin biosynthesis protein [Longispora fulva]GIG63199.1 hypothetical protein Lfu02_75710 [Longispora fulva]